MRTTTRATALALATAWALTVAPTTTASAAAPTCDGRAATVVAAPPSGYPAPWTLGTEGDDVIVGTDGWDRIDGLGGNDVICGLDGSDHLLGGAGNDRLFGGLTDYEADDDYAGDLVEPGPGDDYVDLGFDLGPEDIWFGDVVNTDTVSYANATGPVTVDLGALTATGEGTDTFAPTPAGKYTGVTGSPFDDVLTGGPADDQLLGGGGDDVLAGGEGDDLLDGDASPTWLNRTNPRRVAGDDRVSGGTGDDSIDGGLGADVLVGDDGDDYLASSQDAAGTSLDGGAGDDFLSSGGGVSARGGAGDDTLRTSIGRGTPARTAMTLAGGGGRDRLTLDAFVSGKITYDVAVSVPKRRVDVGGKRFATLTGTEEFLVEGNDGRGTIRFTGGKQPERFQVKWLQKPSVRASGGRGADVLIGSDGGADVLDGGPGKDQLDGKRGRDRCLRGERLKGCELRR